MPAQGRHDGLPVSEPPQQAVEIVELLRRAFAVAGAALQFFQHLAGMKTALSKLDPELLQLPAYERGGAPPPRRRRR